MLPSESRVEYNRSNSDIVHANFITVLLYKLYRLTLSGRLDIANVLGGYSSLQERSNDTEAYTGFTNLGLVPRNEHLLARGHKW